MTSQLIYQQDPNLTNNTTQAFIPYLKPIELGYLNTFESQAEFSEHLSIVTMRDSRITNYEENNVFFSSNYNQVVNEEMCRQPERYFDEDGLNGTMTAVITGCIDSEESILSFDLVQFRNDNHEFASNKTAGLQILLKEDEEVVLSDIIIGQPEGERVLHEYNIPPFKGEMELRFITQSGNASPSFDMLDFDVVMLDNLSFLDKESTQEDDGPLELKVYPNPVAGLSLIHI